MSKIVSESARLAEFMAKYDPEIAKQARAALVKMRKLVPGAVELVYDNYNTLAIGFAPGERASEVVFSIALYPKWVTLFFMQGQGLKDPEKRLAGSGARVRSVRLEQGAATLEEPAVRELIAQAMERAKVPIDAKARRRMVIKSVSAKQRPRRP